MTWKFRDHKNSFDYEIARKNYIQIDPLILQGDIETKGIIDTNHSHKRLTSDDGLLQAMTANFTVRNHTYVPGAKLVEMRVYFDMPYSFGHSEKNQYICKKKSLNQSLYSFLDSENILRDINHINILKNIWNDADRKLQKNSEQVLADLRLSFEEFSQKHFILAHNNLKSCVEERANEFTSFKQKLLSLLADEKEKLNQVQCRIKERSSFRNQIEEYFGAEKINLYEPLANARAVDKQKAHLKRIKLLNMFMSKLNDYEERAYYVYLEALSKQNDNVFEFILNFDKKSLHNFYNSITWSTGTISGFELSYFDLKDDDFLLKSSNCHDEAKNLKNILYTDYEGNDLHKKIAQLIHQ